MRPEDRVRIMHMRDACLSVERFVGSRTRTDLDQDEMLRFALVRAIEIIGEAAARVSADVRNSEPAIPWSEAVGIRNRLIHAYFDIDLDVLWRTARRHPGLAQIAQRAVERSVRWVVHLNAAQRLQHLLPPPPIRLHPQPDLLHPDRLPALVAQHAVDLADVVTAQDQQALQFAAFGA